MIRAERFQVRWWHWLLLVVVVLVLIIVAAVLGLRLAGESRYDGKIADLRAAGHTVTSGEAFADLAPLDDTLQSGWHRWASVAPEYPTSHFPHEVWHRYVGGREELPTAVRQQIDGLHSTMQTARDLIADDRLRLGFSAHAQTLTSAAAHVHPLMANEQTTTDFRATRTLAQWLYHHATSTAEPGTALDDLDRLHHLITPNSLLDVFMKSHVARTRDQTYRALALQGRLPIERFLRWVDEPPPASSWFAQAFAGELVILNDLLAEPGRRMSWTTAAFGTDPWGISSHRPWNMKDIPTGTWIWSTLLSDCAAIAEVEAYAVDRLRRRRLDAFAPLVDAHHQFYIARYSIPGLRYSIEDSLQHDAIHRIERLAVRLLRELPQHGLPHDEADFQLRFGPSSLAAIDDLLALRYERLGDDRFRLCVDPATPVPNFAHLVNIRGWTVAFGRPAAASPLMHLDGSLEIQVPAALSRP